VSTPRHASRAAIDPVETVTPPTRVSTPNVAIVTTHEYTAPPQPARRPYLGRTNPLQNLKLRAYCSGAMPATLEQIKHAMQSTNDLFNAEVFGKRNFAALDDVYTRNARILPPGAPMISGREAISKFWSDLVQLSNASSAVLASVDVMPAGEGMVEIGKATLTVEPPGQSATQMEVKYVVFWQQEDNRWKWHVDIWNQNS
jgi:ketosteroid isomerase-like protein